MRGLVMRRAMAGAKGTPAMIMEMVSGSTIGADKGFHGDAGDKVPEYVTELGDEVAAKPQYLVDDSFQAVAPGQKTVRLRVLTSG
jgi:hypothetical protein